MQIPATCRVHPVAGIELGEGWRLRAACHSEQGTEGVERVEAPIEAESELVEVGLQMLRADPVMDADQPRLEVGEYEMDDRQEILGHFRIATFGNGVVVVAALAQSGVAAPIVRDDQRSRSNGALDKSTERRGAAIGSDRQPDSSGVPAIFPLILGSPWLPVADFDSAGDNNLVMDAPAFAAGSTADVGFIHLDMLVRLAADAVLIGPHHASAQLVENAEGRLVARQPELPLKLHGGYSWCLAGDQIGRPEPEVQRRMAALHDGANQKAGLATTGSALQDARPGSNAKRGRHDAAVWADEAVSPAGALQIGRASRVIREKPLELRKGLRESQSVPLMDIHVRAPYHWRADHRY